MLLKFSRPSLLINFFQNGNRIKKTTGRHERCFLGARQRFWSSGYTSEEHPTGQTVVIEKQGPVLTVGINRPEVRNAVNQETSQRLFEEFSAFNQDDTLNVAVLHGIGGNFCAGYDLKELSQDSVSLTLEQNVSRGPAPMGPSRLRLSKPLIAAVSGYAVAGGLELSLLADLRVVEASTIMGVFCRRFGKILIFLLRKW